MWSYNTLYKLGSQWPPIEPAFSTPEASCESAVRWVKKNEFGAAATYQVDPYDVAIPITFHPSNVRQTFAGRRCLIQDANGGTDTYQPYDDDWKSFKVVILIPFCSSGEALEVVDGSPICSAAVPTSSQDCECVPGDTPVSGPPEVSVGNPILVDSGSKTANETDYRSADGLLVVERQYKSRPRDPIYLLTPLEVPGFSAQWHGLLPGVLNVGGSADTGTELGYLTFLSSNGSVRRFLANSSTDYNYEATDQTRLAITMVGTPALGRPDFYKGAANTASTGEVRLQFKNGEYILFRRAGVYDTANSLRVLVPVEQGKPGGYKQWFDYADAGVYPNRIRDSFGRQLLLTWTELGWSHNVVRGAKKGPNQTQAPSGFTQERGISAIALPDGTTLNYTYEATDSSGYLGRLKTVARKSASGVTLWGRSYLHEDTRFRTSITGIVDQNGARLSTYSYDQYGRATLSKRAGGVGQYQITYSAPTTSTTQETRAVTNPLGLTETYTYDEYARYDSGYQMPTTGRRLLSIDGAATALVSARSRSFNYADKGLLQSTTDANGNVTSQEVDPTDFRPTSVTNANNVNQQITYDPNFDLPTQILLAGKLATNFTYDLSGQMLTRSEVDQTAAGNGLARTTTYTWGTGGRLLSINGPRNPAQYGGQDDVTTFTYDPQGNRLTMTDALNHVTKYSNYDGNGNPGLVTDPNGVKTTFTYDGLGRVKTITVKHPTTAALDAVTTLDYDVEGRIISLTRPASAKMNFDYDLAGRLLAIRADDGERIDYTYDAMNDVLSETVKRTNGTQSRAITRTFDELGQMLTETLGPNRKTSWSYDQNGNPTQVITPRANASTQAFDALDRLTAVTAPAAGTTTSAYDSQNNLASFTDAKTRKTTYTRNGFGDIIKEVSADRGTTSYTYDDGGDVKTMTDGRSQAVTFNRDILGRITSKVPTGLTAQTVTFTWDTGGLTGSYGVGRVGKIVDGSGTTTFQYDHRGNMLVMQQAIGTTTAAQIIYAYDLGDRVTQITYPSGRIVQYGRDSKGRVNLVQTKASASVGTWTSVASGLTYEPFGAVTSITLGNGLKATNDWGNDGRLATRRLQRVSNGSNLSLLAYSYDNDDNIVSITDGVTSSQTQSYAYDAAGRMNRIDTASGTYKRTDYTYDANGNRLQEQRRTLATDATPAQTDTYTYATTSNRLTKVAIPAGNRAITYDGRGNIKGETRPSSVTVTQTYDGYGRLSGYSRTGTSALSFVYNGRDDRVAMINGTVTRRFVYDLSGRVIGEYGNSATDVKAEFIWQLPEASNDNDSGGDDGVNGYAPLAVVTPTTAGVAQINWVHGSHLGVPLVTTDNTGSLATTPNDYFAPGFPGQSRVLSDLYYNRYRDYDPSIGRYIQADPIGLGGGQNPYLYAGASPINATDPLGLSPGAGAVIRVGAEWWLRRQIERAATRRIPVVGQALSFGDALGAAAAVTVFICTQDDGDECAALYAEISRARNEIAKRLQEYRADDYGLPMYGRMSRQGHVYQARGWQKRLRRLLDEADAKGCRAYEADARYLASVQFDRRF